MFGYRCAWSSSRTLHAFTFYKQLWNYSRSFRDSFPKCSKPDRLMSMKLLLDDASLLVFFCKHVLLWVLWSTMGQNHPRKKHLEAETQCESIYLRGSGTRSGQRQWRSFFVSMSFLEGINITTKSQLPQKRGQAVCDEHGHVFFSPWLCLFLSRLLRSRNITDTKIIFFVKHNPTRFKWITDLSEFSLYETTALYLQEPWHPLMSIPWLLTSISMYQWSEDSIPNEM